METHWDVPYSQVWSFCLFHERAGSKEFHQNIITFMNCRSQKSPFYSCIFPVLVSFWTFNDPLVFCSQIPCLELCTCQMIGALFIPSRWSVTCTPPQGGIQILQTSPPYEEFSLPVSWLKVLFFFEREQWDIAAQILCRTTPTHDFFCKHLFKNVRWILKWLSKAVTSSITALSTACILLLTIDVVLNVFSLHTFSVLVYNCYLNVMFCLVIPDNSIQSVVSFDQGGEWVPLRTPSNVNCKVTAKDPDKVQRRKNMFCVFEIKLGGNRSSIAVLELYCVSTELNRFWFCKKTKQTNCLYCRPQCEFHIHAAYSMAMKLDVPMLPLSEPNAVGLILAHGKCSYQNTYCIR